MKGLVLIVPTATVRPDYVVDTETHLLSMKASTRFKLLALMSRKWEIAAVKEFVADCGVSPETIVSIRDCTKRAIYTK